MFDTSRPKASHGRDSLLDRLDPRGRIVATVAFSTLVAVSNRLSTLGLALVASVGLALAANVPFRDVLRRLAPLNLFLLVIAAIVPATIHGTPLISFGPIEFSQEGLLAVAGIALKANAIVLALAVLLGTLDITSLGHALHHLYLPEKLIHLLLFTVRYLDVLRREYGRLRAAMKVRGFRPKMNRHTYRTFGYLVGMLLVRSLDRSERIVAAMKCRGFRGHFYLLDHFAYSRNDLSFAAVSSAVLVLLAVAEWS